MQSLIDSSMTEDEDKEFLSLSAVTEWFLQMLRLDMLLYINTFLAWLYRLSSSSHPAVLVIEAPEASRLTVDGLDLKPSG